MKRELSLQEVKEIEFDILVEFDRICRGSNIKYTLAYGTLLGAIRHKGFIPWDDDIDVIMSREEYDKFLKVWKSEKYELLNSRKGCDFWPLFSRITDPRTTLEPPKICNHGVWVAVIPYDKIPDDESKCKRHLNKVRRNLRLFEIKRSKASGKGLKRVLFRMVQLLLSPFPYYVIGKRVERIKTKYQHTNAKRVNPWIDKIIVDASMFDEYVDVEFEGLKAMATKKYDYFLRYMYNDYMQLPPEEERIPKHQFKAFIEE